VRLQLDMVVWWGGVGVVFELACTATVSYVRGGSRESLVRESRSVCKRECRANLLTKVGLRSESAYM
jgi:hypothetical protein